MLCVHARPVFPKTATAKANEQPGQNHPGPGSPAEGFCCSHWVSRDVRLVPSTDIDGTHVPPYTRASTLYSMRYLHTRIMRSSTPWVNEIWSKDGVGELRTVRGSVSYQVSSAGSRQSPWRSSWWKDTACGSTNEYNFFRGHQTPWKFKSLWPAITHKEFILRK